MNIQKKNVTKLCSFYVSDWHSVTMLLPYINKEINNNNNIVTILEKSISKNIETLVNKLNLKNREKILNLNWNETNGIKYSNINNILKNNKENELLIIINGSKDYIERTNSNIEKYLEKNKTDKKIKILNCYEVTEFNENIEEILDKHNKILNTSGEKEINEVFEGYERTEKLENAE